jgi:amino acid transporter
VFALPLAIWLRYSRQVNGSGGLYSFVEAAAGRPVALVQAGLWIVSYLLYLLYTTAQVVYDTLPAVLPGERRYQPLLEIAIPVALAGVMIAGRRVTLLVTGLLAIGQLAIAVALDGVTLTHLATPVTLASAPAGALATATGRTAPQCRHRAVRLPGKPGGPVRRDVPYCGVRGRCRARGRGGHRPGLPLTSGHSPGNPLGAVSRM